MLHNQSSDHAQIASNPQLLETLLLGLLDPNQVAQATATLTNFLKSAQSCPPLVHVLCNSSNPHARNLAAVYLRSKFTSFQDELSDNIVQELQQVLLKRLVNEPEIKVLRSLGQLSIRVAKFAEFGDNQIAFFQAVEALLQQNNTERTEIGVTILRNLAPLTQGEPFETLIGVFTKGLQGTERMKVESLKGLAALALATEELLDENILTPRQEMLKNIYKMMAQVCEQLITHEDEAISRYVVEMWSDLIADGCLSGAESDIFRFMINVGGRRQLPVNVRFQVAEYMKYYCKKFPNKLIADKLLEPTMELCISLLMEQYQGTEDDVSTPLNIAIEVLDAMFLNVRVDRTTEMALQGVKQLVEKNHIRAALALLAIMTEGCAELMRDDSLLDELYQLLEQGMKASDPACRKVAYEALTQFVYHLSPTMNKYAERLMPAIFAAMDGEKNNQENLEAACITLDSYCSALEESIKPFVPQIFQTLFALLRDSSNPDVQCAAISAISSTLMTTREVKVPVNSLGELTKVLLQVVFAQNDNDEQVQKLQAEAINCLGEVCLTVGPEQTLKVDQETHFIQKILTGAATTNSEIREYTFGFFGTLGRLFQADLLATDEFPKMLQLCTDCLENEDGLVTQKEDDGFGNAGAPGIDEDQAEVEGKFYVVTGFLEEKTAACMALEQFARYCGPQFQRCWDAVFQHVLDAMQYPHPSLKQQSIRTMHFLTVNMMETIKNNQCINDEIRQNAEEMITMVITIYLVNLAREDDRDCAVETLISIAELLKVDTQAILGLQGRLPEQLLDGTGDGSDTNCNWPEFIEIMTLLLEEQTICQAPDDVDLGEAKREVEDNPILDGITDVTSALCKGLTEPQLQAYWKVVFPLLPRYLTPQRSHIEYSLAIGTMGDVSASLSEQSIQPFLQPSVQMAFKGLEASQHHLVRQNSVFALGCLCRAGRSQMKPYLEQILAILSEICKLPRNQPNNKDRLLRDNAISSLGSLLAYCSDDFPNEYFQSAVQVFLNGLPMEDDLQENEHVARNMIRILESRQALMQPYMQQCKSLLENSLQWGDMPQELVSQIQQILAGAQQQSTSI